MLLPWENVGNTTAVWLVEKKHQLQRTVPRIPCCCFWHPSVHQLGSFNSWLQPLSWLALHRYLQLSACNTSVFIVVTPTFILFQAFQSVPGSCCKPGKIHHTVVGLPTVLYLVGTQSVLSYSLLTMFPSIKFWEFEIVHFSTKNCHEVNGEHESNLGHKVDHKCRFFLLTSGTQTWLPGNHG